METEISKDVLAQYQQWLAQSQHQAALLQAENNQLRRQIAQLQAPDPETEPPETGA